MPLNIPAIDSYKPDFFEPPKYGDARFNPHGHVYPDLTFDREKCRPFMSIISLSGSLSSGGSFLARARKLGFYNHSYLVVGVEDEAGNHILLGGIGKTAQPGWLEAIAMDGLSWPSPARRKACLPALTKDAKKEQIQAFQELSGKYFLSSYDIKLPSINKVAYIHAEHDCMLSVNALNSDSKMPVNHKSYRISWDEMLKLLEQANKFYKYYANQDESLVAASFMTTYQKDSENENQITFKHQSNSVLFEGTLKRVKKTKELATAFLDETLGDDDSVEQRKRAFTVEALLSTPIPLAISACVHARVRQVEFDVSKSAKKLNSMSLDEQLLVEAISEQLDAIKQELEPLVINSNALAEMINDVKSQLTDADFARKLGLIKTLAKIYTAASNSMHTELRKFFAELGRNVMAADLKVGNIYDWTKFEEVRQSRDKLTDVNAADKDISIASLKDKLAGLDANKCIATEIDGELGQRGRAMSLFGSVMLSRFNEFAEAEQRQQQSKAVPAESGNNPNKKVNISLSSKFHEYIEDNKKELDITKEGGCPYPEGFTQKDNNDCRQAALAMAYDAIGFKDPLLGNNSKHVLVEQAEFNGRVLGELSYSLVPPDPKLRNEFNLYQYQLLVYLHKQIKCNIGRRTWDDTKAMMAAYHELRLNLQNYRASESGDLLINTIKPISGPGNGILPAKFCIDPVIETLISNDKYMLRYLAKRENLKNCKTGGGFGRNLVAAMDALLLKHPEQIQTLYKVADKAEKITAENGNTPENRKDCQKLVDELSVKGPEWHRAYMALSFMTAVACGASAAIVTVPPLTALLVAVSLYALWTSVDEARKITPAAEQSQLNQSIANQLSSVYV